MSLINGNTDNCKAALPEVIQGLPLLPVFLFPDVPELTVLALELFELPDVRRRALTLPAVALALLLFAELPSRGGKPVCCVNTVPASGLLLRFFFLCAR